MSLSIYCLFHESALDPEIQILWILNTVLIFSLSSFLNNQSWISLTSHTGWKWRSGHVTHVFWRGHTWNSVSRSRLSPTMCTWEVEAIVVLVFFSSVWYCGPLGLKGLFSLAMIPLGKYTGSGNCLHSGFSKEYIVVFGTIRTGA